MSTACASSMFLSRYSRNKVKSKIISTYIFSLEFFLTYYMFTLIIIITINFEMVGRYLLIMSVASVAQKMSCFKAGSVLTILIRK